MNTNTGSSRTLDKRTVQQATKVLLAVVSLAFLGYLVTLVPGTDLLVPQTAVTVAALVTAAVTVVLVALLVLLAPKLATLARIRFDGPQPVGESVASVLYWLVVLLAVLVAHRGFAGLFEPLFGGAIWLYDAIFLLAALPAVAVIAVRLYTSLDPAADLIAERVVSEDGDRTEH